MSINTESANPSERHTSAQAQLSASKRKRKSPDLVADMLESAKGGAKQTAIMYRANLSYDLLKEYLSLLLSRGLLNEKDERGLFHPSEKGLKYLSEYRKYGHLHDSFLSKQRTIMNFIE